MLAGRAGDPEERAVCSGREPAPARRLPGQPRLPLPSRRLRADRVQSARPPLRRSQSHQAGEKLLFVLLFRCDVRRIHGSLFVVNISVMLVKGFSAFPVFKETAFRKMMQYPVRKLRTGICYFVRYE